MQPRVGLKSVPVEVLQCKLGEKDRAQRERHLKTCEENCRTAENEQAQQHACQDQSSRGKYG